jgi:hypothetical protein
VLKISPAYQNASASYNPCTHICFVPLLPT